MKTTSSIVILALLASSSVNAIKTSYHPVKTLEQINLAQVEGDEEGEEIKQAVITNGLDIAADKTGKDLGVVEGTFPAEFRPLPTSDNKGLEIAADAQENKLDKEKEMTEGASSCFGTRLPSPPARLYQGCNSQSVQPHAPHCIESELTDLKTGIGFVNNELLGKDRNSYKSSLYKYIQHLDKEIHEIDSQVGNKEGVSITNLIANIETSYQQSIQNLLLQLNGGNNKITTQAIYDLIIQQDKDYTKRLVNLENKINYVTQQNSVQQAVMGVGYTKQHMEYDPNSDNSQFYNQLRLSQQREIAQTCKEEVKEKKVCTCGHDHDHE